jgi:hypothetical protein
MGIFDTIGSAFAPDIGGPITAGLRQGYNLAQPQLTAGLQNVNQLYQQAIPYLQQQFAAAQGPLQNVYQTGAQGVDYLKNLLGFGPGGAQGAQTALESTPGYQFTKQQGQGALDAAAAASGNLNSGNLIKSLADYTGGLASQTYQGAVNNLSPFTNMFTGGANQLSNLFTGLGTGVSNLLTGQAQQGSLFYTNMANLGWGLGTGTGAAGAQQNLADYNAGAGLFNSLLNFGGSAGGSGLLKGLGGLFSDRRLKEDIEPVGKMFDGSNIYKFRYKGDATPRIGLMADEVALRTPEAVGEVAGFKTVDYGKAVAPSASIFDAFMKAA